MFKFSIVCAIFLTLTQVKTLHAHDDVNTIVTHFTTEYGLHYVHVLNPKETVYSLSKFSGTSVKDIYDINGLPSTSILSIGQELIIPVRPETVITDSQIASSQKEALIKVMYKVKKKDNLFQIAKRHFATDINTIINRNKLSGLTISPDQILHIGWISLHKNLTVQINKTTPLNTVAAKQETVDAETQVSHSASPTSELTVTHTQPTQTASQVINETIDQVNSETVSSESEKTPKYRVVQHSSLHKKEQPKPMITEESSQVNGLNPKTIDVQKASEVSVQTEVSTQDASYSDVEHSPTESTKANTTVTAAETKKETIKSRDYPDLSFLSSPNLLTQRGIAMWDKNDNEPLNMFILHKDAKVGSYIRIENPMLGRIVLAKVVARLPTNVYDQDVVMVVSTAVASSLGVKDSRFLAEMKYVRL